MSDRNIQQEAETVIKRMNHLLSLERGFRANTKRARPLHARLKEHSLQTIMELVDWLFLRWRKWDERSRYFNPTTIFRASNFERYLEDMEIELERKRYKSVVREKSYQTDMISFEDYFKAVLDRSGFIKAQYLRLPPERKRTFENICKQSFEENTDPDNAISVNFFTEVA
tara:strand:- start:2381 stop:2890 length:510 start_codon:yes stop_codon:yes gene_type:complete